MAEEFERIEELIKRTSEKRFSVMSVWHDLMERALENGTVPLWATDQRPLAADEMEIEVECSSGTYVRVLASDLTTSFGSCSHLLGLCRLQCGDFSLSDCLPPSVWTQIHTFPDLLSKSLRPSPKLSSSTSQKTSRRPPLFSLPLK